MIAAASSPACCPTVQIRGFSAPGLLDLPPRLFVTAYQHALFNARARSFHS